MSNELIQGDAEPLPDHARSIFDPRRFTLRFGATGHNGHVGVRYVSHGTDYVELMAPFQAHLAGGQDERTLADGAIVTLLDMAGTLSIFAKLGRFRPHATVELRIDSLAVAPAGSGILARAECYHIASRIAFVRGVARTEENLEIARLAATYMFATQ